MNQTQITVKLNLRILPFGHSAIEIKNDAIYEKEKKEKESSNYLEPQTTNPETMEIIFDGDSYSVPKTTSGIY